MTELKGKYFPEATGMPENPQITHAIEKIAGTLVNESVHVKKGDKVLIWYEDRSTPLALELLKKCQQNEAGEVAFFKRDLQGDVEKVKLIPPYKTSGNESDKESDEEFNIECDKKLEALHADQKRLIEEADVIIIAAATENAEKVWEGVEPDKRQRYFGYFKDAHASRMAQDVENPKRWILFRWPLPEEAQIDHLSYEDYFTLFLEACDQPWKEIHEAQDILIEKLDKGKQLEIFANEYDADEKKRTHLTLSIDGMTFGNSTIEVNYPGSEVYSAPVKESVDGQLFAPGEFFFDGKYYKDIFLEFEHGKIIKATCFLDGKEIDLIKDLLASKKKNERGEDTNELAYGEGAVYLGEIALGTNPGLVRKFINTLLREKVGGSFHIAIGSCYKDPKDKKVHVNNGNTSKKWIEQDGKKVEIVHAGLHWDITVLMHPTAGGGRVLVDGEEISTNGCFKDPRLAILNPPSLVPKTTT